MVEVLDVVSGVYQVKPQGKQGPWKVFHWRSFRPMCVERESSPVVITEQGSEWGEGEEDAVWDVLGEAGEVVRMEEKVDDEVEISDMEEVLHRFGIDSR